MLYIHKIQYVYTFAEIFYRDSVLSNFPFNRVTKKYVTQVYKNIKLNVMRFVKINLSVIVYTTRNVISDMISIKHT